MLQILHSLQWIDEKLFYFINLSLANHLLDVLMTGITTKQNWYLPGGIIWLFLIIKGGRRGRIFAGLIVLAIVLSDQISSSLLKPYIARFRPCKTLDGFRLLVHCGSKYGFPSSHATNAAAIATLFVFYNRNWAWLWVGVAFLIGISRVYVGVHYPFDVLAGWMLGILISLGLVILADKLVRDSIRKKD